MILAPHPCHPWSLFIAALCGPPAIPARHRWLLCSLVIAALAGPPAHAAGCAPVNETRARDAARAYLKVPADMSFELVASHPVGTSCYTRLLFETVDTNQIRESTIY